MSSCLGKANDKDQKYTKKKNQVVGGDVIFYVAHIYYDVKKKFFFQKVSLFKIPRNGGITF